MLSLLDRTISTVGLNHPESQKNLCIVGYLPLLIGAEGGDDAEEVVGLCGLLVTGSGMGGLISILLTEIALPVTGEAVHVAFERGKD